MLMGWRCTLALAAVALSIVAGCSDAWTQAYPARGVRIIVPFSAGGAPDVVGRVIAQGLAEQTGQSFVVENRPGADGVVGAHAVAQSAPDGYTLLVTSSSFVINPSFHKNLPFNVLTDFEPVSNIAAIEAYILGVNPAVRAQTVAELIALTRDPAARISFGSPGVGNSVHLVTELFKSLTKTQMVHVPYRGAGQALTGLIAGDVQVMFMTPPSSMAYVEGAKVRALAYTGARRFSRLPNVPTMAEAGVPGMEDQSSWTGLFAPARTPPAVIARLHEQVAKAIASPAVRDRLIGLGVIPVGNTPAEFKPFVVAQVKRIADIVKAAGIEPH